MVGEFWVRSTKDKSCEQGCPENHQTSEKVIFFNGNEVLEHLQTHLPFSDFVTVGVSFQGVCVWGGEVERVKILQNTLILCS